MFHVDNTLALSETRSRRLGRTAMATALAGTLLLGACTTTNNGGTTLASGPVVDANDSCSIHREPIAEVKKSAFSENDALTAVAVGVGTGVLVGVLSGDWRAGVGTAVAAGGGTALVSYMNNKNQIAKDQASLLTAIDGDAAKDGGSMSRVQSAVNDLRACRTRQFQALTDDLKAGRITKEQGRQRYATLNDFRKRDDQIVNEVLGEAEKRASLYTEARMKAMKVDNVEAALASYEVPNTAPPVPVMSTLKPATVKSEPAKKAATVTQYSAGTQVEVLGTKNGWTQVRNNGQTGYIQTSALKETGKTVAPPPVKKVPEVAALSNSLKETKKANEAATQQLAAAQDNARTLLD